MIEEKSCSWRLGVGRRNDGGICPDSDGYYYYEAALTTTFSEMELFMPSMDKKANAILKHDEDLLARIDSYDVLKHKFLSLSRKY